MSQGSQVTVCNPEVIRVQASGSTGTTNGFLPQLRNNAFEKPPTVIDKPSSNSLLRITDIVAPHSGYIRILELNNPSTRNAISRALLAELGREIDVIQKQYDICTGQEVGLKNLESNGLHIQNAPTRALIIASALDSCFSSGADLKERKGFTLEETTEFLNCLRSTFTLLSRLPIPTISAVGSLALGGGLELALATNLRVVTSNAAIALPETRLGIIPGAGGIHRLSTLIGVSRARKLVLTGRRVTGLEAYRLGIADILVEMNETREGEDSIITTEQRKKDEHHLAKANREVLAKAVALAEEICQGGPVAVRAAIQAFQVEPDESIECAMYDRVMQTEDRIEALVAFGEKRRPRFKGR